MPLEIAVEFSEAITVLEARDALVELGNADYPYMKRGDRNKRKKELEKIAFPKHIAKRIDIIDFVGNKVSG